MDTKKTLEYMQNKWDTNIIPALQEYIKIPNQSPHFDKDWATNGLMEKAVDLIVNWVKEQKVEGLQIEVKKKKLKQIKSNQFFFFCLKKIFFFFLKCVFKGEKIGRKNSLDFHGIAS